MAGSSESLRSTLTDKGYAVLLAVAGQAEPSSRRAIAAALGVTPTTTSTWLSRLETAGFVTSSRSSRSVLWRLNTDSDVIRGWLREEQSSGGAVVAEAGSSPVSTGGGGVTFERKVAAEYLAQLLLTSGAVGLGPSRVVVSVAFQQAPQFTVDDLVIGAAGEGESEPSVVLAVAARRTPNVVDSDEKSQALFRTFVKQLQIMPADGPELLLGLAVNGPQDHVQQLAALAALAAGQSGPRGFFTLVRTPKKFDKPTRDRLAQVEKLVRRALVDLGSRNPADGEVEQQVWALLSRLVVRTPRVESADEQDWSALADLLAAASRGKDLHGGTLLRDRLLALADDWAPRAASVDLSMLRRAVHDLLDSTARRNRAGWRALELLGEQARAAVGDEIVSVNGLRRVRVGRSDVVAELTAAVGSAGLVVVHGESGVGKSAIALGLSTFSSTATDAKVGGRAINHSVVAQAGESHAVCFNLRHLPRTVLELEGILEVPLRDLLAEMSAPDRLVVVDGADAVAEGAQELLTYVVHAAVTADVTVVAVTAGDARQLVVDTMAGWIRRGVVEVTVPPLSDAQIETVVGEFPELEAMAANPRSRELLRRPVVVDLLVRGGVGGVPLSDFDAMQQIWDALVRRRGAVDRGTPVGRDVAMQLLARHELQGGVELDVAAAINPEALDGLRRDGLLRRSSDNPFRLVLEFAHEEVRRYAVARLLLADEDPTRVLLKAGVPRWALGAARLACQALLLMPDCNSNPMAGRFERWQSKFDELVHAGFGERWTDVPGEALLTLGDSRPVLREAWPQLQADGRAGVQRLFRLIDQRLRGKNAFVRTAAVEPLVELLMVDETPWQSTNGEQTLLVEWLQSLVGSNVPAGYELRKQLRARLLRFCAAADERLLEAETARAAARAASTDEQRAAQQARTRGLPIFGEVGYPRSRRRRLRSVISQEITDETVVELFALLGPDLGADGEAVLRRIAEADPRRLAPAMEGILCGRALAGFRRGFLADMTLAYYLDEEEDGTGGLGHDDGVRDHQWFGVGTPQAAWYRGPFMALFQTDFRNGVAVLNRILNHAATVRPRILTSNRRYYQPVQNFDLDRYRTELDITGAPRMYTGDSATWNWYRGTGVGPQPCMSALQALERVCNDLVGMGAVSLDSMIPTLLDGCHNVAMVALVVGLLVRRLEQVGTLLDRFLAEPDVWHLEFVRAVQDSGGLRRSPEAISGSDRRAWSLREAATALVLAAGTERADELRLVGHQLVEKARRRIELGEALSADAAEVELGRVRMWASGLDRSTYTMRETDDGYVVQSHPPVEVTAILSAGMSGMLRSQESVRLTVRYHVKQKGGAVEPITTKDLVADLNSAVTLLDAPTELDVMGWDAPAAVAAYALIQYLVVGRSLPNESVKMAAEIVLRIGENGAPPGIDTGMDESYYPAGADRFAASVLPLLLTTASDALRRLIDGVDGTSAYSRAEAAVTELAHSRVAETRLYLARGLDHVWTSTCTRDAACPHQVAWRTAVDLMRECVFGPWDIEKHIQPVEVLSDPIVDTLRAVPDDRIYVSRLDATIRALGPAVVAGICVSGDARALLKALLDAQRRALLSQDRGTDDRGTHSLVAARALLTVNDHEAITGHIDAYVDNSTVLDQALRALSAAAEEDTVRADAARRIWPRLVERVIDAHDAGHTPFEIKFHGRDYTLAALLPAPAGEGTYLYSEVTDKPLVWWDPLAWPVAIERWLGVAGGKPICVDNLVRFLASSLPATEQARLGMPWVARAVLADPAAVANRCYSLTDWLVKVRSSTQQIGLSSDWQRAVDALVVAGDTRLAPYSE